MLYSLTPDTRTCLRHVARRAKKGHLDRPAIFRYHVPITSGNLLLLSTLVFFILISTDLIQRDK